MQNEDRRQQIVNHAAAWGRRAAAERIADHTDLTVAQAIAALEAAPRDPASDLLAAVRSVAGGGAILPDPPAGETGLEAVARMLAGRVA